MENQTWLSIYGRTDERVLFLWLCLYARLFEHPADIISKSSVVCAAAFCEVRFPAEGVRWQNCIFIKRKVILVLAAGGHIEAVFELALVVLAWVVLGRSTLHVQLHAVCGETIRWIVLVHILDSYGLLVALVLGKLTSDNETRNLLQQLGIAQIAVCIINLVAVEDSLFLLYVVHIRNVVVQKLLGIEVVGIASDIVDVDRGCRRINGYSYRCRLRESIVVRVLQGLGLDAVDVNLHQSVIGSLLDNERDADTLIFLVLGLQC